MDIELNRCAFVAFFLLSFVSRPTSATEKEKLLTWIQDNSDMFLMLKHWNELPLISNAWKRLKTTPRVQEDRKNFIKNAENFLKLFGDDLQIKRDGNGSKNDQIHKANVTQEAASSHKNSTSGPESKDNAVTLVNANQKVNLENPQTDANQTRTRREPPNCENVTMAIIANKDVSTNPCICNGKRI